TRGRPCSPHCPGCRVVYWCGPPFLPGLVEFFIGAKPKPPAGLSAKLFSTRKSSPTCRSASLLSIQSRKDFHKPTRHSLRWRNGSVVCYDVVKSPTRPTTM